MEEEKDDILETIGEEALWMQLAEEAAELSQAAAKMARFWHATNPTMMEELDIRKNVIEEYSDVVNCARHLHIPVSERLIAAKNIRWRQRLGLAKE